MIFYKLDQSIEQCKNQEITFVKGDINTKVGESREEEVVEPFGLG